MPGHDWKGGVIYSPTGLVNMKSQAALGLKLFFWKTVLRKQHCFLPHSGPQSLRFMENSVCQLEWNVPRLESHFSFPLTQGPQDTSQFVDTTLQRMLSSVGGVTLRPEAVGRNPSLGDIEWPGDLAILFWTGGSTNSWVT